jgi:hypothetical protein
MADFAQRPWSLPSPEIGAPEPPVPAAINADLIPRRQRCRRRSTAAFTYPEYRHRVKQSRRW